MNKLFSELQRLYFLPAQHWLGQKPKNSGEPAYAVDGPLTPEIIAQSLAGELGVTLNLLSVDNRVRAMLVIFARNSDWEAAAKLFQVVQEELGLPAPALSVSGRAGFRLWFSLEEAVPVSEAQVFLVRLQRCYLSGMVAADLQFRPDPEALATAGPALVKLTPALHLATGKWSAFIDPSLGSMFVEDAGLAMAPNMDKQAQILAGLESIKRADFERAQQRLEEKLAAETVAATPAADAVVAGGGFKAAGPFTDPESFLLAVMNDPAVSTLERIRAAEALLPRFARGESR